MATPRMDPSFLEITDIIRYPAAEEAFLREFGLGRRHLLDPRQPEHYKGCHRLPSTGGYARTPTLIQASQDATEKSSLTIVDARKGSGRASSAIGAKSSCLSSAGRTPCTVGRGKAPFLLVKMYLDVRTYKSPEER
ncbi:hypothetical protein HPB52_006131 [Rhipicephalus sanguineus]|uniref:Uncharacterized protein n=1 Tax=Rhipicephalus sanguineus TaxID=34632 RepID=A0A9D4PUT8_RHISA|nr:hypothetical protein HPB52_006131 [Rhipicephalus sanguineus]